jgi:TnpA family transposase
MRGQFLSQDERERLSHFPPDVSGDDLIAYFTLTPEDMAMIGKQRRPHNRLGFALLLCALRYLGFLPLDLGRAPAKAVAFVASQIQVDPDALRHYASRAETRREHLGTIMKHIGFRRVGAAQREALTQWLAERALEHDRPSSLVQLACERLYKQRLVRPAVTTVERIVIEARQRARRETYRILTAPLSDEDRQRLDELLIARAGGRTSHAWLRRAARGCSADDILEALQKLALIETWPVEAWRALALPRSRFKHLGRLARRTTNQGLQRMSEERRYPILIAFLVQSRERVIDEVIELFDGCLEDACRRSRWELKEHQSASFETLRRLAGYFHDVTGVILDEAIEDEEIRPTVYGRIPQQDLAVALTEMEETLSSLQDARVLDYFDHRYGYFRRFAPELLNALTFHSSREDDSLLEAIEVLREMNKEKRLPKTLENVRTDFVPSRWQPYVLNSDGTVKRRGYEMCALSEMRDALRSGDLWVEESHRYAELESYFIPKEHWPALRPQFCEMVGTLEDGEAQLRQKQMELEKRLKRLDERFLNYEHVRIQKDRLVVTPLERELDEEPDVVGRIGRLIPRVQLAELLREVDTWTDFSQCFEHAGGSTSRTEDLPFHLYASILAQACNLDISRMAELTDLSRRQLIWCTSWYIREETLQAATNTLVNHQYRQPLSHRWGDGTLSSSDGQRFAVAVKTKNARPLPRYFGYGRGLTLMTWTSDQLSQYVTRVTPPTVRDATYVLDAILDNETDLDIHEHTTDTAGYTDLVFVLFDLLGLQFSPRLRDIGETNLYCVDSSITYENIASIITRPINVKLILEYWDDILRVAASLKMGWVTASLLIRKLQAFPRQHKLTQALQEYGRLVKTIFIAHYLDSPAFRRRILIQLNKGEAVHSLRRFLFFDNLGLIRGKDPQAHMNQAGCLNVLANAVVVWNTVYMQAAIDHLKAQGYLVNDEHLAHLSPARHQHINPYGKFRFEISVDLASNGLRPLHSVQAGP